MKTHSFYSDPYSFTLHIQILLPRHSVLSLVQSLTLPIEFVRSERQVLSLSGDDSLTFAAQNVQQKFLQARFDGSVRRTVELNEDTTCEWIAAVTNRPLIARYKWTIGREPQG